MDSSTTQQIHAPYHFAPLSKWVMLPEWSHLVSYDVPFEDGLNGTIRIRLSNITPLLVGAEQLEKPGHAKTILWHKTPDGKPLIPGSSLKGMLRSVLEIASFGKFNQVGNNHFAYRDLSRGASYLTELQNTGDVQAAWLRFDNESSSWTIRNASFTLMYDDDFNSIGNRRITIQDSAVDKYRKSPLSSTPISFELGKKKVRNKKGKIVEKDAAVHLGKGAREGVAVFVGERPGMKVGFNYMFYEMDSSTRAIDNKDVVAMFNAHDPELVAYLKSNGHPQYGIPIFVRRSKNTSKTIMGLAKMPKKLYKDNVESLKIKNQELSNADAAFDLAELIFGTLREHGLSLKSRVNLSDAVCVKHTGFVESGEVILGAPRASYLNAYIEQPKANALGDCGDGDLASYNGQALNGPDARLKGWKRYPRTSKTRLQLADNLKDKVNLQSHLELLHSDAEFVFDLHFHNLKAEELGALLWVITLNEQPELAHSLGYGKPLGLGSVQLKVDELDCINNLCEPLTFNSPHYISKFVQYMEVWHPASNWLQSTQVKHLLSFADWQNNDDEKLDYMSLDKGKVNYANSMKGDKKSLPDWQGLSRKEATPEGMASLSSYGKGRLSVLLTESAFDAKIIKEQHAEQVKHAELKAEEAKKALLNSAPSYAKPLIELLDRFSKIEAHAKQSINAELEQLLFSARDEQWSVEYVHLLVNFVRRKDVTYLQISDKKKKNLRKTLLSEICVKYGLDNDT